jgi:hypothetical protein
MSRHLSSEESIAALEGTLEPDRRRHVDGCPQCRRQLGDLQATLGAIRAAGEVDEPSPLFWDHLSGRVREAVADERPAPRRVWLRVWQPLAALTAAAVLVWVFGGGPADRPPAGSARAGAGMDVVALDDQTAAGDRWNAVVEIAADLSVDEVHRAVPSRLDTVVLFDELSAEERAALADLLAGELGDEKGLE